MKNYYKLALADKVDFDGDFADGNAGTAMIWKGISRGQSRRNLYHAGVVGEPIEMVVGAKELFEHGLMRTITEFFVDIAHLLLMAGGLYLLASSMGWLK